MDCPKVAIFDLDNTLSEPYTPISKQMAACLSRLIGLVPASIMSAASLERVRRDVVSQLSHEVDLRRLTLFTANAGQSFAFKNDDWMPEYRFEFNDSQLAQIKSALEESIAETDALKGAKIYGEQFVDYKGYFAFTSLGIGAPVEERRAWDPDFSKRKKLRDAVERKLPGFDVYIGGSTSIDVTLKGINKAYGIEWLSRSLGIPAADMLYVGDALYENGNDFVVVKTGVQTRKTKNPEETLSILEELLTACPADGGASAIS